MKAIVLYYSYGGNTRKIAAKIQKALTCDAAEIKPQTPYVGNYNAVVEQGQREINSGYMPKLQPLDMDLSRYDTIILGTPVWWYTFAPAMKTFLHNTDFNGKEVYLFATNGGWLGHTFQDFKSSERRKCPHWIKHPIQRRSTAHIGRRYCFMASNTSDIPPNSIITTQRRPLFHTGDVKLNMCH